MTEKMQFCTTCRCWFSPGFPCACSLPKPPDRTEEIEKLLECLPFGMTGEVSEWHMDGATGGPRHAVSVSTRDTGLRLESSVHLHPLDPAGSVIEGMVARVALKAFTHRRQLQGAAEEAAK